MNLFFQGIQWLKYWLSKQSQHSIHGPHLFEFYSKLFFGTPKNEGRIKLIESSRTNLLKNNLKILVMPNGSASFKLPVKISIKKIAQRSLTPERWCQLFPRIIDYLDAKYILELGTSLGISTLYLSDKTDVKVWTVEGNVAIAEIARELFLSHKRKTIDLIIGDLDQNLDEVLNSIPFLDFVFMDANHKFKPTITYAEKIWKKLRPEGILVADDINRSDEMLSAWRKIQNFSECSASFNLFRWGILVKGPSKLKGHHIWGHP